MPTEHERRGPYRTGLDRRRRIVESAFDVFARRGYANASLREIAEAVDVSTPGLLHYFRDKNELFIAVLDRWKDETAHLAADVDMGTGMAYFAVFPRLMRYHVEHPGLIVLFLTLCAESTDPAHPARAWVATRYASIVERAVEHLQIAELDGDVAAMTPEQRHTEVRSLFAVMDGLELQWIADPTVDMVGYFDAHFAATVERWMRGVGAGAAVGAGPAVGAAAVVGERVSARVDGG